jgi:hypothetical protein
VRGFIAGGDLLDAFDHNFEIIRLIRDDLHVETKL